MQIADRPPRPIHAPIPPAFLVALVIMVGGGALVGFIWAAGISDIKAYADRDQHGWVLDFARYGRGLVGPGIGLATSALMILGYGELVRRAGRGPDGLALRLGLAAVIVVFLVLVSSMYVNHWYLPRHPGDGHKLAQDFWRWQQRVVCGAALVATGALLIAGRRLFSVQALAVPFVIVTLFAYPVQSVWELFHDSTRGADSLWIGVFIDLVIDGGFAAMMILTLSALGRALPPPPVDVARAGNGLQRVGSALVARVLVAVVAAFTLITTFGAQSIGLAKISMIVFPLGLVLASVALVTGMFQAAGLAAQGAPRLRLYAAGACTTIAFLAEGIRALALYNLMSTGADADSWARHRVEGLVTVLPYFIPALALAGLLLLLSAVDELRRWAPAARTDRQMVVNAAIAVALFSIAQVVLLYEVRPDRGDIGFFILIQILLTIANIVAQISVARVCHRVAEEMREAPALPTAIIAPPRP